MYNTRVLARVKHVQLTRVIHIKSETLQTRVKHVYYTRVFNTYKTRVCARDKHVWLKRDTRKKWELANTSKTRM